MKFNQLINVSGIRHPERTAFGWRWIAFQLLHLFSSLVILHRYCGGRKCYVCNVNPYNKTVSTGVISKRLPLLAVGRTKPQPECLAFGGGYFTNKMFWFDIGIAVAQTTFVISSGVAILMIAKFLGAFSC